MPSRQEDDPKTGNCKACGAAIRWAKTENGRWIPLDAKPEKRFVIERVHWGDSTFATDTYVSHFATCPAANVFRKAGARVESADG